jgi:hypothetical protein
MNAKKKRKNVRKQKRPAVSEKAGSLREERRTIDASFQEKLKAAPLPVQSEYHRCSVAIGRLLKAFSVKTRFEGVLYPGAGSKRLTGIQIAWLLDLLSHRSNTWDVRLSKPLDGTDDSEVKLLFRWIPDQTSPPIRTPGT